MRSRSNEELYYNTLEPCEEENNTVLWTFIKDRHKQTDKEDLQFFR